MHLNKEKPLSILIFSGFLMVEARGVEPLSENLQIGVSTCVVYDLDFRRQSAHTQAD